MIMVPMSSPDLTVAEIESVDRVLKTPYLSFGPHLAAFEQGVADKVGAAHGVGSIQAQVAFTCA